MKTPCNTKTFAGLCLIIVATVLPATGSALNQDSNNASVQEDTATVKRWNQFVDDVYQLHLKQIEERKIKTEARSGSYYRLPYFYQEIKFYDKLNDRLLSKVEWETRNPDNLHGIEVHVHDNNNRLLREYFASYLPKFRNAPYQTLINLHNYNRNLHSFRQFDASDNLIYEVCVDTTSDKKIYEHVDYEIPDNFKQGAGKEKNYQQCFSALPRSAGIYLEPQ